MPRRAKAKDSGGSVRPRGEVPTGYVEYSSNNSGGSWWLSDADWLALEKAGWRVAWRRLAPTYDAAGKAHLRDAAGLPLFHEPTGEDFKARRWSFVEAADGRWLGTLATTAYRAGLTLRAAADEWERVTGKSSTDAGCSCCGQPHTFTEYDTDGKWIASGPEIKHECEW